MPRTVRRAAGSCMPRTGDRALALRRGGLGLEPGVVRAAADEARRDGHVVHDTVPPIVNVEHPGTGQTASIGPWGRIHWASASSRVVSV
jgi:hypothetical protein